MQRFPSCLEFAEALRASFGAMAHSSGGGSLPGGVLSGGVSNLVPTRTGVLMASAS